MISKRISSRKDGKSSAKAALRYGEGLSNSRSGLERIEDKSHRTRLGNFGLIDNDIYSGRSKEEMADLLAIAAQEMQANCDLNTRITLDKKIAHFVISYNQAKPCDAVLQDTEDSILAALKLESNHFATFLHSDNGYWHLHMFVSRIDKIKHLGNPLWQDRKVRDRICREIEARHKLDKDNGIHEIDPSGQIVEIPRKERQVNRNSRNSISDRTRSIEKYSGVKSFQSWAIENRLGDHLKHAKSWQELHVFAAECSCEIKSKGAGYIICPVGESGGMQLSKLGLKNLQAQCGEFEAARSVSILGNKTQYMPVPIYKEGVSLFSTWQTAKAAFIPVRNSEVAQLRANHNLERQELKSSLRDEIRSLQLSKPNDGKQAAISITKMKHAASMTALSQRLAVERKLLNEGLALQDPGRTYREFLCKEAVRGDPVAIGLMRKFGSNYATDVARDYERKKLRISATFSGQEYKPAYLLKFAYKVESNGTIVYELGNGRVLTDSAISKQVQLNHLAAIDPDAVETALRYASLKLGNRLVLHGSQEFKKLAVAISVNKGLPIVFEDPALEKYHQQLKQQRYQLHQLIVKENQNESDHSV